jgi:hypothetical protein
MDAIAARVDVEAQVGRHAIARETCGVHHGAARHAASLVAGVAHRDAVAAVSRVEVDHVAVQDDRCPVRLGLGHVG